MIADIALCCDNVKKDCPLAGRCYRATAEPCAWGQSYFIAKNPGPDCGDFIDATPKDKEKKCTNTK